MKTHTPITFIPPYSLITLLHHRTGHFFLLTDCVWSPKPYLLPAVYPVPPQDWRAARCHPHSCQRVAVHLVLLYDALSFFVLQNTNTQYLNALFLCLTSWRIPPEFRKEIQKIQPLVGLTTYIPPCWPSWILLCLTMGQLFVLIWIPARALP